MEDDRQALVEHILTIDRRFYRFLLAGGGRDWADVDLTMPQLKVLYLVSGNGEVNMTGLARTLGMTTSTVTGVVDRLVDQGLVRREDAAWDRRLILLRPTEQGLAMVDHLVRTGRDRLRLILDGLDFEDLMAVAQGIDTLYEAAINLSAPDLAIGLAKE